MADLLGGLKSILADIYTVCARVSTRTVPSCWGAACTWVSTRTMYSYLCSLVSLQDLLRKLSSLWISVSNIKYSIF